MSETDIKTAGERKNIMKRVLVFGMTENPGGVESVIMNYYRHIDRSKIQFDFLCNSYEKVAYEEELLALGGRTFHFPARSRDFLKYKRELDVFFRKHASEYSAIWVNICSLANIDYLIEAKKYGIPKRIIHSHNSQNMDGKLRGLLHEHNKKRIAQYATDFWACSEDAARWFYEEKLLPEVEIIHNAIDVDRVRFDGAARRKIREQLGWENEYIIGNIGRLHFQKNQAFILDIFRGVLKEKSDARLVLVGQGEDEQMLKDKIRTYGLEEQVRMVGVQSDIPAWLSAFDLFLFPSRFEGMPLALMEAEANGLPVLLSKDVIPETVKINQNVVFQSLESGSSAWKKQLLNMAEYEKREEPEKIKENFVQAGYEIGHEVKRFEMLMMEK